MSESIQKEIVFPQPPEKVWAALTSSAAMADWLMPNDFEPTVGHHFTCKWSNAGYEGTVDCEVLECEPPVRLAYSWASSGIDTRVSFRLAPEGDGTRLFFEQSGFDTSGPWKDKALRGADAGWTRMLQRLVEVVAG